jgi:hypothetical protein
MIMSVIAGFKCAALLAMIKNAFVNAVPREIKHVSSSHWQIGFEFLKMML